MENKSLRNWFVVLGILSIVGNAWSLLSNGLSLLFLQLFQESFQELDPSDISDMLSGIFSEEMIENSWVYLEAFPVIASIKLVSAVGSLVGVSMLFKGNRQGFMWYLTAQIIEVVLPTLLINRIPINALGAMFSLIFVYVFYKYAKALEFNEHQDF